MKREKATTIFLILIIVWTILLLVFSISSPQDFCNPCDYPLQPGEVMRVTTLTASTPDLLNTQVEEFIEGLDKVVKVDRSQFPEKVIVWHIDYAEPETSIIFNSRGR